MTFWLVAAAISLVTAAGIAWPLLRARPTAPASEARYDIAVYRDQLGEIERDRARGLLGPEEAAAARTEIERRLLAAGARSGAGLQASGRHPLAAALVVLVVVAGAFALYHIKGAPGLPDQPLAERLGQQRQQRVEAGDIGGRADALRARLESQPEDAEGWIMLARSYFHLRRYAESSEAYRRAMALTGDRPGLLSAYAEALTLAQGNRVPQAARLAFEQALAKQPDDPRARYYLGLYEAQAKRFDRALERWQAQLAETPADAPWRPMLVKGIRDMARFLEIDAATVLPAEDLGVAETEDPVARLRSDLAANPKDWQGWLRLARAEAGRGDSAAAKAALERVSALYPEAPFVQQQIRQAAAELGLAETPVAGRGPSRADMAAAAGMSEAERSEMIESMVAGLAARLESEPDDLEGWLMLIRSQAVLGRERQASQTMARALDHFAGQAPAEEAIRNTAISLGLDR